MCSNTTHLSDGYINQEMIAGTSNAKNGVSTPNYPCAGHAPTVEVPSVHSAVHFAT